MCSFFSIFTIFIVSYACVVLNIWLKYPDVSVIADCPVVFFIRSLKLSARMSCVFQWAIHTFHLVYATFLVLIYLQARFYYVLYCVSCSECCFYLSFFKKFCDFLCFFPYVRITHFLLFLECVYMCVKLLSVTCSITWNSVRKWCHLGRPESHAIPSVVSVATPRNWQCQ
jgi:hypothetical protein